VQHVPSEVVLVRGQSDVGCPAGGLLRLLLTLIRLIIVHDALKGITGRSIIRGLTSDIIQVIVIVPHVKDRPSDHASGVYALPTILNQAVTVRHVLAPVTLAVAVTRPLNIFEIHSVILSRLVCRLFANLFFLIMLLQHVVRPLHGPRIHRVVLLSEELMLLAGSFLPLL
jgi:hypothetical protein